MEFEARGPPLSCTVVLQARHQVDAHLEDAHHAHLDGLRAPTAARRFLRERLADLPAELVDTAELLTSEIVTNGLLHGRTDLEFGVSRIPNEILVTVADGNSTLPGRRPMPSGDEELTQGGRGMALIVALADDFGWRSLPDRPGKVGFFTVRIEDGERDRPMFPPPDDPL